MFDSDVTYSVVVPCYMSDRSLPELVDRLEKVFDDEVEESFEIILVDDGSPNPKTWPTIEAIAETHDSVTGFRLTRNFGKAGALLCGFSNVHGEWVIILDDDLQHAPEDIPKLLTEREHDISMAFFPKRQHGPIIKLSSKIKGWFDRIILGKPKDITFSPFMVIRRGIIEAVLKIRTPFPFIPALLLYVTKDIVTVPVEHFTREYGKTTFTFIRRFKQFSNLLISNSALLLRAVAWIGVAFSVGSLGYAAWLVVSRLFFAERPQGWTSIMVAVLAVGGIMLFSMGVVGEYLIRIIRSVEGWAPWIIREKIGGDPIRAPEEPRRLAEKDNTDRPH